MNIWKARITNYEEYAEAYKHGCRHFIVIGTLDLPPHATLHDVTIECYGSLTAEPGGTSRTIRIASQN